MSTTTAGTFSRLRLPVPPSTNALFYNRKFGKGRGRIKTPAYRRWLAEADGWYLTQKRSIKPMSGKLEIQIRLPPIRGDITNRIKAAEDYLVSRGLTGDDRHNHKVSVEIVSDLDCCEIIILALDK